MNNLEQLLKQYGEDQRQQASLAGNLRRKARRQRRVVAIVGCLVMISAIGLMIWKTESLPQSEVVVAENHSGAITADPKVEIADQETTPIPQVAKNHPEAIVEQSITAEENIAEPVFEDLVMQVQTSPVEDVAQVKPIAIEDNHIEYYSLDLAEADLPKTNQRLHFSAMLGANTPGATAQEWNTMENNQINDNCNFAETDASSTFSAKPLQMVRGNVGVTYALADSRRIKMEAGVTIGGFWHKADVQLTTTRMFEIKGGPTPGGYAVNVTKRTHIESVYGLNVALPLSWSFYPKGEAKSGWVMRISPAYNLLTSKYLGSDYGYGLNAWKLELSAGIRLPKGIIKSVNATANLLPLYQHGDLHEFGISIGF